MSFCLVSNMVSFRCPVECSLETRPRTCVRFWSIPLRRDRAALAQPQPKGLLAGALQPELELELEPPLRKLENF